MSEIDLSSYDIDRDDLELLVERDNPLKPYAKQVLESTRRETFA
jgi:hypothetical protein